MTLRLSLCMIVRNNEAILGAALQSIQPWVDELVVIDTGSTDRTPALARDLGAAVFDFPWCDSFAAARNESLRRARGDWLFWMDSDDTISAANGRRLRELALGAHPEQVLGYVLQVHCPGQDAGVTVVDHVKLVRRHPALRFEGRIHEQILPAIRRLDGDVRWTDIFVTHSGSDQSAAGRQRKFTRDVRLLELELQDHPEQSFCLFNCGMTYADAGQPQQALHYLRRCLAAARPGESHVRKAYALFLGALAQVEAWDEARQVVTEAVALFPDDQELAFRQGIVCHAQGRFGEAVAAYRRALRGAEERYFNSMDAGLGGYKAHHNLGVVYRDQGDLDLAEDQWRLALAECPPHRPSAQALADVLLQQRRCSAAAMLGERWAADARLRSQGLLTQADVRAARGDISAAVACLAAALTEFPEDLGLHQAYCQRLFEAGRWEEAGQALASLCALRPADAAAHHNLGLALAQLGRSAEAIAALERSLVLRPQSPSTQQQLARLRATSSRFALPADEAGCPALLAPSRAV